MRDLIILLGISIILLACGRGEEKVSSSPTPFLNQDVAPIDTALANMSVAQKIGQLILLRSNFLGDTQKNELYQQLEAGKIGGLLLEELDIEQFIKIMDVAHVLAETPLFVATNEEVLLNNQFSNLLPFPSLNSVQATGNDSLQRRFLELYARQANQLGVNLSLSTPYAIAKTANSFHPQIANLNSHKILSGVKKIPVNDILVQRDTSCRLEELMEPFVKWHRQGAAAFYLQGFDEEQKIQIPYHLLQHYFRQELGFQGLLISEIDYGSSIKNQLDLGTDLFIVNDCSEDLFDGLMEKVEQGALSISELDDKVRRILLAKKWAKSKVNTPKSRTIEQPMVLQASFKSNESTNNTAAILGDVALTEHFKNEKWDLLRYRIYEKSMVLLNNRNRILPFKSLHKSEFRLLHFGPASMRTFQEYFGKYADFKSYHHGPDSPDISYVLRPSKSRGRTTIITLDDVQIDPEKDTVFIQSLNDMAMRSRVVLINFGDPKNFHPFDTSMVLVQIYERNDITESLAAQLLFGAVAPAGKLPNPINDFYPINHGLEAEPVRLKYGIPQEVGIAPEKLVGIDAIINTAIQEGAMPGCQVLVAKDGNVVYSKAFGYHSFMKDRAVKTTDLYDLASITKVAATTLATMQLYEEGKLKLDDRLQEHLDWEERSTIKNISLKKLLTHHSGLQSNVPIAPYIMYRDVPNAGCDSFFCNIYSDTFSIRVADNFYFDQRQIDNIWEKIHSLPLGSQRRYRYSDVNFMLLQKVIETVSKQKLDTRLNQEFYDPLGLRYHMFNPSDRFGLDQIAPTQNDYRWRHQLLRGYVHDESAALFGGVAGNAGLFSNAEDLAVPFQMLLNKGSYGGIQFLQPETVDLFTKTHTYSRRGLGFYKPFQGNDYPVGPSSDTYGHTGFTGTAVWADPEHNLLYIFLANRIHPNVSNKAFSRSRVRQRVQQVIYDALDTYDFVMPDLPLTPEEKEEIKG